MTRICIFLLLLLSLFFLFFFLNNNVQTKYRGDPNMTRIRILLDQENSYSLIKAYIKESHCCSFLSITLKIY